MRPNARRIVKWLGGIAAALVLLAVVAVITITTVVDPNRFKGRVETLVREQTGRPFEIKGDLDIAWFPWLGIRTGPAQLDNPPQIPPGPPLARWRSMQVGLRLIPMLRGEWRMGKIRFEGLELSLRRFDDGAANWDGILKPSRGGPSQAPVLTISGFELRNAALNYSNAGGGALHLSNWQLDVGAWKPGARVPIHMRFELARNAQPAVPVELDVPELELAMTPLSLAAPRVALRVAGAKLTGSAEIPRASPLRAHGDLSVEIDSLRQLMKQLAVDAPLPRDPASLAHLSLTTPWSADNGAYAFEPIDLRIDDSRLRGKLLRGVDGMWHVELHGDRIDLSRYANVEPKRKEPFELPVAALRRIKAEGVLAFDRAQFAGARINNVRLRLEGEKP